MAEQEDHSAAAAAADIAMRTAVASLVGIAVQIGALMAVSWAIANRDTVALHARRVQRLVRRDRTPGDAGAQVAEHAADVALISHAGGDLS